MPEPPDYLRIKANRFRLLAGDFETAISTRLLEVAAELERQAEELERRASPSDSG